MRDQYSWTRGKKSKGVRIVQDGSRGGLGADGGGDGEVPAPGLVSLRRKPPRLSSAATPGDSVALVDWKQRVIVAFTDNFETPFSYRVVRPRLWELVGMKRRPRCPRTAEHPYRRGENAPRAVWRLPLNGTSPQAWGKRPVFFGVSCSVRNIPTGVGKTRYSRPLSRSGPEHPHRRGENSATSGSSRTISGTSPQAWGKRRRHRRGMGVLRNIPTGVGKTWP